MNSLFTFSENDCLTKAKEPNLLYYLPIIRRKTIEFMPFSELLAQRKVHHRIHCSVNSLKVKFPEQEYLKQKFKSIDKYSLENKCLLFERNSS